MKNKKEKITIIGQCYNEEEMIPLYYEAMTNLMKKMNYVDFEIIFIDDHSQDESLKIIKELASKDERIKCISMAKNFGREACAMAGFKYATGDYITTMDLDLQDPPELLISMYDALKDGKYDIAAAKALTRKGYSFIHKMCTKIFFGIINKISSVKMVDGQREYRLMTRQVVQAILEYKEYNLFNKGLLNDVGFNTKWIEFENIERVAGNTKFPYKRMIKYAITGIIDYSLFPLIFVLFLGIGALILDLVLLLLLIIFAIANISINLSCFILIILSLFMFGVILCCMGITNLYIAQIHLEVKHRPIYTIKTLINIDKE